MSNWDDLTGMLLTGIRDSMGVTVPYTYKNGSTVNVDVVFGNDFIAIDTISENQMISQEPNVLVKLSDFAQRPKKGDSVTIKTVIYYVHEVRDDGEGGAELMLQKNL